jgi:hypothetical protein
MEATRVCQHAREQPPLKINLLQLQPLARVLDELSAGLDQVAGSWVSGHLATRIGSANSPPEILKYTAPLGEECLTGQNAQVYCVARSKARAGWR